MPREESDVRRNDSIIPCFICVELVIMVGTVLLTYYLEFTDIFSVHRQGFFCFDSTYTKPYPGPEETSLLPPVLLQSLASAVPMTTIAFGELAAFVFQAELVREERTIVTADCCSLNPLLRRVVRFLGVYAFGLCTTDIFVNAGQVVTGSPAPHFMTVCQPNYTALGCQLSTQFISSENACTGSPGVVSSARRAFPCKDSALTMYAAVYTVVCCVLHNFKSLNSSQENPRNVREPVCVKLALPCVESPLEKIAQLHSQKVRDRTSGIFPSTPDVLIATQSVMSEV
ncbi:phospholipid phosphatase-related protein type 5-like isoform X3 [Stegostoma tigrinum]|uniref:phospholipid phosphatase-related protein type 5-like isoform X3 n=1 Tax=Stegostoma tigrinum TaxID=3053191 RepID=UPI00202B6F6C|nr:phospholipid phosphatase-related protein type 5-like isoform X3 [Stegostoma tigrinum]